MVVSGESGTGVKCKRNDAESLPIRTCPGLMVHISQLETQVVTTWPPSHSHLVSLPLGALPILSLIQRSMS